MVRLTVRIPEDLYQRFAAFADGRTFHRGDTQLADSVRDALAHYLACPHKRMTKNGTVSTEDTREQTTNGTEDRSTHIQQILNGTVPSVPLELVESLPLMHHNEQTQKSTESLLEPENSSSAISRQPTKRTTLARLDTDDLEDMPFEPESASAALLRQTRTSPTPVPADTPRAQRRALLLTAVPWDTETPGGISPADLRSATGISKIDATNDLDELRKHGHVIKVGKGLYARPGQS